MSDKDEKAKPVSDETLKGVVGGAARGSTRPGIGVAKSGKDDGDRDIMAPSKSV